MTFTRLVASSVLLSTLVLVPAAFGQDLGGGAAAPTPAAPTTAAPAASAPAEAAQEDQPTTPEGEEQPPEQEPNGEQPPTEENGEEGGPVAELPEDGAGGAGEGGSLPETGLQLIALTSIGLGLLLAGAALWPTSSWPPPRDRRSRSTTRRPAPPPRRPQARPRTR
jgi:hypothetical protein